MELGAIKDAPIDKQEYDTLNIFKNQAIVDQCIRDDIKPFEECHALNRLFCGLNYYQKLDTKKIKNNQQIFVAFIKDVYSAFIDDYTHLVCIHGHEIENIHKYLTQIQSLFGTCDIKECSFTSRHYQPSESHKSPITDFTMNFYEKNMDSLHFYLLHLFQVGLRIFKIAEEEIKQQTDDESDNDKYFDATFNRINEMIKVQRDTTSFDRLKNNNKFNLVVAEEKGVYTTIYSKM